MIVPVVLFSVRCDRCRHVLEPDPPAGVTSTGVATWEGRDGAEAAADAAGWLVESGPPARVLCPGCACHVGAHLPTHAVTGGMRCFRCAVRVVEVSHVGGRPRAFAP